jgi:hypothetical protein
MFIGNYRIVHLNNMGRKQDTAVRFVRWLTWLGDHEHHSPAAESRYSFSTAQGTRIGREHHYSPKFCVLLHCPWFTPLQSIMLPCG